MKLVSINPATGETLQSFVPMTRDQAFSVVEAVHQAWGSWRRTPFSDRKKLLERLAALLRKEKQALAALMTREMGKPLAQSVAEVEKCAWVCDYYAVESEAQLGAKAVETEARKSFVAYRPLGTVLAIMPWNFPLWQVFRFAAPALMAGNVGLLKHAPNVCGCSLAIEDLFRRAGFPANVFRSLLIEVDLTAQIIAHPLVHAVTLTGSTRAGQAVAAAAGQALKKTVLELGGSDPYIVLEDADIARAAETCMASRLLNSGQSCIAAKRFLVVDAVLKPFEQACLDILRAKTMGDCSRGDYDLGPLAREDLRDNLHRQVQATLEQGARCLLGGQISDGPGYFYPPTLLTGVRPGMTAFDEETFGPVAAIVPVSDEAEAVQLANATEFGLGAAVFTGDLERGERIAVQELEAGSCFVNDFVKSDPRLPFGGIKQSGYGRELAEFGIREFVNIKTVYVK